MSWATRSRAHAPASRPAGAAATPKTEVSGVLGVPARRIYENASGVSGVLGVGGGALSKITAAGESRLEASLLAAAMRACDHHGDGPAAREQMRADCLATPPGQRADLLDHFNTQYPKER